MQGIKTTNEFSGRKGKLRLHWANSEFMKSQESGKQLPPESPENIREYMDDLAFLSIWFNEYFDRVVARDTLCLEILTIVRAYAGDRVARELRDIIGPANYYTENFMWRLRTIVVSKGFTETITSSLERYVARDDALQKKYPSLGVNEETTQLLQSLQPADVPRLYTENEEDLLRTIDAAVIEIEHCLMLVSAAILQILHLNEKVAKNKLCVLCLTAVVKMQIEFPGKQDNLHRLHQFNWPDCVRLLKEIEEELMNAVESLPEEVLEEEDESGGGGARLPPAGLSGGGNGTGGASNAG